LITSIFRYKISDRQTYGQNRKHKNVQVEEFSQKNVPVIESIKSIKF
jgi:hypothetical protein